MRSARCYLKRKKSKKELFELTMEFLGRPKVEFVEWVGKSRVKEIERPQPFPECLWGIPY
jgi:hypothetical protein